MEETAQPVPDPVSGVFAYLDGILRHREGYFTDIFENRRIWRHLFLLLGIIVVLSGFYGLVMGASSDWRQMLASAVKIPVLYLLTVAVCYPVLYVVIVIMGSRLGFLQTLTLILLALALSSILLASCAPIVLFFTLTGADYHFLKLLNVAIFAFGGAWGMLGLWRGLTAMCESSDLYPRQAVRILQIWALVFAFVGMQMTWSLRPFVGAPGLEFQVFRAQQGNFYEDVWKSFSRLTKGR
ncbi:MAG: actin-binding WH2 domain-containing protein [FCB group bacterium]|nr:actin-binding WH2 domain-containing protein [FCB group bacterium]